ncbi:MAG: HPP family protein [Gammaproteobacteria bacterium]|nr:HPP family protein [Gammaproteobacteria bacterium]
MWYQRFIPQADVTSASERLFAFVAALLSILFVAGISHHFLSGAAVPLMIASMGASAVLLFAVPGSRFSHPWAVFAGHMVSVAVGVTCVQWIGNWALAAALAVAVSIALMQQLRCLHPPGGAAALVAVVGDEHIHALGYKFLITPVLLNVLLILLAALLLNNLLPGRRYPQSTELLASEQRKPQDFSAEDLTEALRDMDGFVDVSESDLQKIYYQARMHSRIRQLGAVRCSDVMQVDVLTVQYGTELDKAWHMMREHRLVELPVVDAFDHVMGMLTLREMMHAVEVGQPERFVEKLHRLLQRTPGHDSDKHEVVGQLMRSELLHVSPNMLLSELIPQFAQYEGEYVAVVDEHSKLLGLISRAQILQRL